jgi:hypothetical protein
VSGNTFLMAGRTRGTDLRTIRDNANRRYLDL